jgi:hypothetical protein
MPRIFACARPHGQQIARPGPQNFFLEARALQAMRKNFFALKPSTHAAPTRTGTHEGHGDGIGKLAS